MKVSLALTHCGRNLAILWQVDLASSDGLGSLQQVLKVWQVGTHADNNAEIPKAINTVIALQQSYSGEYVRRCRQRPACTTKRLIPIRFDDGVFEHSAKPQIDHHTGARAMNQEKIDMAS